MARSGRFGNLPARAPDLSMTIVSLLEAYESARDRNILSAWMNGGLFEGKKVTDQRIKQWFKSRRSEYQKDDPEYDYWDQQLRQIDYQIGESKMLLKFEQGRIKEGGAAAWYTSNAKRFPKNSEAWREAMRNAARFKKAAQETSRAGRTISKSERYDNEIQRIVKNKIAPGEEAIDAWERMLRESGYKAADGFMGLNPEQMAGDEDLRRFLQTSAGRRVKRRWERTTGRKFTFKAMRQMVKQVENGYNEAAGVAKRYGFESYVSSFRTSARNAGEYHTQFKAYNGDIYDRYLTLSEQYKEDLENADTPAERNAIRDRYSQKLEKLAARSSRIGDVDLAGSLRNESLAVQGKPIRTNATGTIDEGGKGQNARAQVTADDLNYVEQKVDDGTPDGRTLVTGVLDETGLSSLEIEMQQAIRDQEADKGLKDGSWMWMKGADNELTAIPVANLNDFYGSPDFVSAGAKLNFKYNPDGTRETVLINPQQLYMDFGNGLEAVPGYSTYETINGQTRFVIDNGPDAESTDTAELPWAGLSEFDDGDPRSPSGSIGYTDDNGVFRYESTYEVVGDTIQLQPRYMAAIEVGFFTDALGATQDPVTGEWKDAEGKVVTLNSNLRQTMISGAVRNMNYEFDADGTPRPVSGYEPIEVIEPNPDYVPPLRERLAGMTVEEVKEELSPEQWEQFKAEVDRTLPGGSVSSKLRLWEEDQRMVGEQTARSQVITNLYENPDVATFGGSEDPAVQAAAVTNRQGATDEDIEFLMARDNSSARLIELRQTVEDFGPDTPEGQDAQARLDEMEQKARTIAESNIESGVTARGDVIERTEDDDFGFRGDPVDPESVAAVTRFEGTDGEVGAPTQTRTIEVPEVYVIADTGATSDESGILAQFQSPLGREQLARMPAEQRQAILQEVVEANGQTGNPDYTFAIANEIDALTYNGKHSGTEEEYNLRSGSLSDDERMRNILVARRIANVSDGVSLADPLEKSLWGDLKSSGWTDEQIKTRFPQVAEERRNRLSEQYSILPGPYDSRPGVGNAATNSPSAVTAFDGALRNAQQATAKPVTDAQGITYPQGLKPDIAPIKEFQPVTTVRPKTPTDAPPIGAQTQFQQPTTPIGGFKMPTFKVQPPPSFGPTGAPPPPTTPAYRQPSFKAPGIK